MRTHREAPPTRRLGARLAALSALGWLALAACSGSTTGGSPSSSSDDPSGSGPKQAAPVGMLPAAAQQVMSKPAYATARWLYDIRDLKTGKVLFSNHPDELAFTGSTMKLLTIGTLYDTVGPAEKLTTPVYAAGTVSGGTLRGDLDLVASGDLTLGGREAAQGKAVHAFTATTIDHVYGDIAPNGAVPAGNPLAGLEELAKQVRAKGITRVDGNVVIDTRLWDAYTAQEGPVPPIYVNDNVFDIEVTPGAAGQPATVAPRIRTQAFRLDADVKTESGSDVGVRVVADEQDPRLLHVTGSIGSDAGKRLTIYRIPDAASWARTLFIEALGRAGVTVTAPATADNDQGGLPARDAYRPADRVASYVSPPLSAFGSLVMETSYNTGANAFLCLIAVHEKSTDCEDGLKPIHALTAKAGMAQDHVILKDGQGGDPVSVPPSQMVKWLQFVDKQSWAPQLKSDLPVLGETGTLAASGRNSPAKGKIAAKTGTSAAADPTNGRTLFNVQALAGYMTAANGETLVFDVLVSGATFPDPVSGVEQVGDDVGDVAAAFQQAVK